jgi:hypothetical protein
VDAERGDRRIEVTGVLRRQMLVHDGLALRSQIAAGRSHAGCAGEKLAAGLPSLRLTVVEATPGPARCTPRTAAFHANRVRDGPRWRGLRIRVNWHSLPALGSVSLRGVARFGVRLNRACGASGVPGLGLAASAASAVMCDRLDVPDVRPRGDRCPGQTSASAPARRAFRAPPARPAGYGWWCPGALTRAARARGDRMNCGRRAEAVAGRSSREGTCGLAASGSPDRQRLVGRGPLDQRPWRHMRRRPRRVLPYGQQPWPALRLGRRPLLREPSRHEQRRHRRTAGGSRRRRQARHERRLVSGRWRPGGADRPALPPRKRQHALCAGRCPRRDDPPVAFAQRLRRAHVRHLRNCVAPRRTLGPRASCSRASK